MTKKVVSEPITHPGDLEFLSPLEPKAANPVESHLTDSDLRSYVETNQNRMQMLQSDVSDVGMEAMKFILHPCTFNEDCYLMLRGYFYEGLKHLQQAISGERLYWNGVRDSKTRYPVEIGTHLSDFLEYQYNFSEALSWMHLHLIPQDMLSLTRIATVRKNPNIVVNNIQPER
jgi:hypothetical protein